MRDEITLKFSPTEVEVLLLALGRTVTDGDNADVPRSAYHKLADGFGERPKSWWIDGAYTTLHGPKGVKPTNRAGGVSDEPQKAAEASQGDAPEGDDPEVNGPPAEDGAVRATEGDEVDAKVADPDSGEIVQHDAPKRPAARKGRGRG